MCSCCFGDNSLGGNLRLPSLGGNLRLPFSSLILALADTPPNNYSLLNFSGKPRTGGFGRSITSRYRVATVTQYPLKSICIYRKPTASISWRIAGFYTLSNLTHTFRDLIKISGYALSTFAIFIT